MKKAKYIIRANQMINYIKNLNGKIARADLIRHFSKRDKYPSIKEAKTCQRAISLLYKSPEIKTIKVVRRIFFDKTR